MPSMCGKHWEQIACPAIAAEDEVEFRFINYHKYGNKEAYKEILSTAFLAPLDKTILESFLKPYITPFEMMGNTLLIKTHNHLAVDVQKFKCDSYDFEKWDVAAINSFRGEYMADYSWAEFTNGRYAHIVQELKK